MHFLDNHHIFFSFHCWSFIYKHSKPSFDLTVTRVLNSCQTSILNKFTTFASTPRFRQSYAPVKGIMEKFINEVSGDFWRHFWPWDKKQPTTFWGWTGFRCDSKCSFSSNLFTSNIQLVVDCHSETSRRHHCLWKNSSNMTSDVQEHHKLKSFISKSIQTVYTNQLC